MSQVNILNFMAPGASHSVSVSNIVATQALTSMFISLVAVDGPVRFRVNAAPTATVGHYIQGGERLDIAVPEGATLQVIQATGSAATAVEITELV